MSNVFEELVASPNALEKLVSGFEFTEGPAWNAALGYLVFSDIPNDMMWRWSSDAGLVRYRQASNKANGNFYDGDHRLITCEHATSRVVRELQDGGLEVLADHFENLELNSPNDVVVDRDGAIYFTDPTYGRQDYVGVPRPVPQPRRGVYRIASSGEVELVSDAFVQPNGLCFSPDGSRLYVNDTERMNISVFSVADGRPSAPGRVFADVSGEGEGGPDGMKVDEFGNVWCTGPGGLHVFDATGQHIGHLPVPEVVGNFAWGGAEMRSLFICASSSLYRIETTVRGHHPFID